MKQGMCVLTGVLGLAACVAPLAMGQPGTERKVVYDAAALQAHSQAPAATQLCLRAAGAARLMIGTNTPFDTEAGENKLHLSGWRGERCSAQLAASTCGGQTDALQATCTTLTMGEHSIPARVSMIRYTKAHGQCVADIIGTERSCPNPAGVHRGVWLQIDIPQDAAPGVYKGSVSISAQGCEPATHDIELRVEDATLPGPKDWRIHLDLWQHPQAVARWHDVEPWSAEHFALLRPIMKRLAEAGQKCITCTVLDEAWNGQTYDTFPSMVRWIRGKDGHMRYDYSVLDAWVSFMHDEIGIREQISCYSMLPWHLKVRYYDEASGHEAYLSADPAKPEFEAVWAPFLQDFHRHMQEKGWAKKTCIAIDERPDPMVRAAMKLVALHAPSFRIASAVDKPSALTREVYNISPVLTHAGSALGDLLRERKAAGRITTFYVCLHPTTPNTFTHSAPAESEWLGFFAAANGLDGFLRWAYNSWNRNPMECTDFVHWPSGDCFLVYPGNRSSIRFERLRDGIEEYEKINLLRARAAESPEAAAVIGRMNARLAAIFTVENSKKPHHTADVEQARHIIRETLDALPKATPARD
ncbi:MAG: DUF4091 domain-containing protein [Akkermansia sp.]|nr:DUF4091 domain-containing protein [Akkermansia sp.]